MRKFLTTGLFSAILGLAVGTPADASLVSRGFLDEALENYATTTALDLKANQSDFTELSNKIGDAWPYTFNMLPGLHAVSRGWGYPGQITIQNASDLLWFLFRGAQVGVLNTLAQSVVVTGEYSIGSGQIDDGFRSLSQLTDGWTDSEKKTYLGVKGLNDKIGTLPTEIVIGNSNGPIDMFNITKSQRVSLPKDYTLSDFIQNMYYGSFGSNVGLDSSPFYGLSDIIDHVMYGGITGEASPELTGKQYKGLIDLTREINKIGTVPDGKNLAGMISETDAKIGLLPPDTTVAGMIGNPVLLSKEQTIIPLSELILFGSHGQQVINPITEMPMPFPLLGLHDITREVNKIGTLPTEYATVGAALTAMDAKIDARELPSTSADGQYVLSAKKVGDTITYTWVKMDLTNEEQAQ